MTAGAWLQGLWWLLLAGLYGCWLRVWQQQRKCKQLQRAARDDWMATLRNVRSTTMYRAASRWIQEGGDPVVGAWMGALGDLHGQDERLGPLPADPFEILGRER